MHALLIGEIIKMYDESIFVLPGVEQILSLLADYLKAITSSSPRSIITKVVEKLN